MPIPSSDRVLLCCDLDRTLLPNGPQPESALARPLLRAITQRPELALAYVTGRDRGLILEAIEQYELPQPDFAVGDVGTAIYRVEDTEWRLMEDWAQTLEPDWAGTSRADLAGHLEGIAGIERQPSHKLGRFKLSYYVEPKRDLAELASEVGRRLSSLDARLSLITSFDEQNDVGLLDVLPAGANKLHAVRFLVEQEGFLSENTVFAGDSGNDLAVLTSEIRSVLVRNAHESVRGQALEGAREAGHADRLYLAAGHFLGLNGNYSAGALEGLAHFVPRAADWLRAEATDLPR